MTIDSFDATRAKLRERHEHEHAARRLVVTRSRVNHEDLVTTFRTLRALGAVTLDDLIKPPGFDSLGNANADTQEWRDWAMANDLVNDTRRLSHYLCNAENELVLEHHWHD